MDKSALIIRNVSALTGSEVASIISLCKFNPPLVINQASPDKLKEFQAKINNNEAIPASLIRDADVRDYIFATTKQNTGDHLILHLDHNKEDAEAYILGKLNEFEQGRHVSVFYLGGGHGGGFNGQVDEETSGLKKKTVQAIITKLEDKGMNTGAAVFGSCYSAAFTNEFRDFLLDDGIMLADSVECGHNGFDNLVRWRQHAENIPFFTLDEIQAFKVKPSDMRTKFNELVGMNEEVAKKHLLEAYADHTKKDPTTLTYQGVKLLLDQNSQLADTVKNHRTDLLDKQILTCSTELQALGPNPAPADVQQTLEHYPWVNEYVQHAIEACAYSDKTDEFVAALIKEINRYEAQHNPGADDDISDALLTHLQTKFPDAPGKNFFKIFEDYAKTMVCSEKLAEFKDAANGFKNYLNTQYNPDYGVHIPVHASANDFYKQVVVSMQKETVTSKVLSSNDDSQLMELDPTTGKPLHTCDDAYDRVKKVINIIGKNDQINLVIEHAVDTFNQSSVMSEFNESFAAAMLESARILKAAREAQAIVIKPLPIDNGAVDHLHALKGQLEKMKGDANAVVEQNDSSDDEHPNF
ncbi:hypothetical protein [Legionella erythra]|uniref:hypothetical protein n=1 Tax=Legionella erythra TaxID=448 RepID=UPI00072FEEB2|nr:hypothetical protein [Legionella erythra]